MAGKPYYLRTKVEIPVELQVQDDGAFLNEFSSQPTLGQSKSVTDIESNIDALVNGSSSDSNLQTMWHDRFIQEQVENRLKELSGLNTKGIDSKIKSQRGGSVDVYVNQKVKWPHEFVLFGTSKDRLNYNQLNITQWMAGFCRIMRDEESLQTRGHMLDYLIALLDDSNDFSWEAGKASHAVLLCRMEQGEIASWAETKKSTGSKEQMRRDIHSDPPPTLVAKIQKPRSDVSEKCQFNAMRIF